MALSGTVYFDFASVECFRLFLLLVKADQEGADLRLTWRGWRDAGSSGADELDGWERALAAHALVRDPVRQDRFRQALFASIHRQDDSPDDELTYRAAARVAGVDADVLLDAVARTGRQELDTVRRHAAGAGVTDVPAIVAGGPVLHVVTTAAVSDGPATPRIDLIGSMLEDDGLWRLVKP